MNILNRWISMNRGQKAALTTTAKVREYISFSNNIRTPQKKPRQTASADAGSSHDCSLRFTNLGQRETIIRSRFLPVQDLLDPQYPEFDELGQSLTPVDLYVSECQPKVAERGQMRIERV
jgi:hypothetical protein